jgi:hypothetical protein
MKIFLDDDPIRDSWVDDTWTIARTVVDALELLNQAWADGKSVETLSLDHDLGEFIIGLDGERGEMTGYTLLQTLEQFAHDGLWDLVPKSFEIHSANPVGRKNMQAAIDSIERMRNAVD